MPLDIRWYVYCPVTDTSCTRIQIAWCNVMQPFAPTSASRTRWWKRWKPLAVLRKAPPLGNYPVSRFWNSGSCAWWHGHCHGARVKLVSKHPVKELQCIVTSYYIYTFAVRVRIFFVGTHVKALYLYNLISSMDYYRFGISCRVFMSSNCVFHFVYEFVPVASRGRFCSRGWPPTLWKTPGAFALHWRTDAAHDMVKRQIQNSDGVQRCQEQTRAILGTLSNIVQGCPGLFGLICNAVTFDASATSWGLARADVKQLRALYDRVAHTAKAWWDW